MRSSGPNELYNFPRSLGELGIQMICWLWSWTDDYELIYETWLIAVNWCHFSTNTGIFSRLQKTKKFLSIETIILALMAICSLFSEGKHTKFTGTDLYKQRIDLLRWGSGCVHYTVGHFAKIRLIFRAILGSLKKWKRSRNGSKMAKKGQKSYQKSTKVSQKW